MIKERKIECFVPAKALEHKFNSEFATLHEKIRWAIIRYYQTKDFFSLQPVQEPVPGLLIISKVLNKEELGYTVAAVVRHS